MDIEVYIHDFLQPAWTYVLNSRWKAFAEWHHVFQSDLMECYTAIPIAWPSSHGPSEFKAMVWPVWRLELFQQNRWWLVTFLEAGQLMDHGWPNGDLGPCSAAAFGLQLSDDWCGRVLGFRAARGHPLGAKRHNSHPQRRHKNPPRMILGTWDQWFSRMRSEGSRFIWGSGGEAVFAESCVYVRNRSPMTVTVCVSAVRLSTVATAPGVILKACQVDSCRRSYIGVCRGGVCVSDLCRRSYISVCSGGVSVSDLCHRIYIGVWGGGVCVSGLWRRSYIGVCRGVLLVFPNA